jgi:hypothetical protein
VRKQKKKKKVYGGRESEKHSLGKQGNNGETGRLASINLYIKTNPHKKQKKKIVNSPR